MSPATLPAWRDRGLLKGYIYYFLSKPQKASLSVVDDSGKLIRKLDCTGDAGINRVVWDLTTDEKKYVASGVYQVKLTIGSLELVEKIEVRSMRRRR